MLDTDFSLYLEAISSFFKAKHYKEWSIVACLEYISEKAILNFEDVGSILDDIKRKLKSISNQQNLLSPATRNKSFSIYSTFEKTIKRQEVKVLLERIEKKAS